MLERVLTSAIMSLLLCELTATKLFTVYLAAWVKMSAAPTHPGFPNILSDNVHGDYVLVTCDSTVGKLFFHHCIGLHSSQPRNCNVQYSVHKILQPTKTKSSIQVHCIGKETGTIAAMAEKHLYG